MRTFSSLVLILSATPAFAFLGSGGTSVSQEYACVSLDGVPIQQGSDMAQRCCSNGQLIANAPDSCRAGFNTIGPAAGEGAAYSINIAQNTLQVAQNMNGAATDFTASPNSSGGSTSGSGGSQSDTSAIHSGTGDSGGTSSGAGTTSGAGAYTAGHGSGSGSNSGNGSGSGAGSGSGSGGLDGMSAFSANTAGKKGTGADDGSGNADSRLAYVSGKGDGANGAHGANGFGLGGAGVGMDKGLNELSLGDENANRDPNALGNADEDGALGTAEDPADYFKRIDQSANIFKIVSARYMKKKSLFKVKP